MKACVRYSQQGSALCLEIPPEVRGELDALLSKCEHGYVSVAIDRPRKPRTTGAGSQNHHLNGHIMQICRATGNDYEAVKYAVKQTAAEQYGYPFRTVAGKICPKRERDCSTEECAMLIEAAHYIAAECGIFLTENGE